MIDSEDDPELDELARALRAATLDAPASTVAATRARVVASAKRRAGGPSWALAAAAVLAIVLGGSTVWAFFTGRLSLSSEAPVEEVQPRSTAPEPPSTEVQPRRARPSTAAPEPPALEPPAPEPAEAIAAPVETTVESAVASAREPRAQRPIDPAERRAYDAAHRLHFEAGDWPAAIDAWDAYLASFPRGRFGLEARYNRALALVRAGRASEARDALAPFAEGRFGAYRRTEARALLEALAAEPTP